MVARLVGEIKPGDLVWAKMKTFPPWPGRIMTTVPPEVKKPKAAGKDMHYVYFFGSNNYGWVRKNQIQPYELYKDIRQVGCRSSEFKKGCAVIANQQKLLDEGYSIDPFDATSLLEVVEETTSSPVTNFDDNIMEIGYSSQLCSSSDEDSTPKEQLTRKRKRIPTPAAKEDEPSTSTGAETKSPSVTNQHKVSMAQTDSASRVYPRFSRMTTRNFSSGFDQLSVGGPNIVPNINPTTVPAHQDNEEHKTLSVVRKRVKEDRPKKVRFQLKLGPARKVKKVYSPIVESQVRHRESILKIQSEQEPANKGSRSVGFLGLGQIGGALLDRLLSVQNGVSIWNRSARKCARFVEAGAVQKNSILDVVQTSDITILCVADSNKANDMVFKQDGVAHGISTGKGFVNMATTESEKSLDMYTIVHEKFGRYLEAQIHGGKREAEEGQLVILAAGDSSLFDECQPFFNAMAKKAFYLGRAGEASKMNLVMQSILGPSLTTLAEAMSLASSAKVDLPVFMEILKLSSVSCPLFLNKGLAMSNKKEKFVADQQLRYMQRDLNFALNLGNNVGVSMSMAANANEIYKRAKVKGYGKNDAAAVCKLNYKLK